MVFYVQKELNQRVLIFPAASNNKSKVAVALSLAICGAFGILCLGIFCTYAYQYIRRHKNDVFVDVSGIFPVISALF